MKGGEGEGRGGEGRGGEREKQHQGIEKYLRGMHGVGSELQ